MPDTAISKSEQSRRSFDETIDQANRAIQRTRAEIARSRALSQSEAKRDRVDDEPKGFGRESENAALFR